jgi:stage III sporulation protein AH
MAAAVLVTVCAGIYLNWLYTEDQQTANLEDTVNASKLLDADTLVLSDTPLETENTTVSDYFAAVRLSRQQARDSAVSLLQEAMAFIFFTCGK